MSEELKVNDKYKDATFEEIFRTRVEEKLVRKVDSVAKEFADGIRSGKFTTAEIKKKFGWGESTRCEILDI